MSKLIHYSGPNGSYLLPSGFLRLSWILSSGTLWIDTKMIPTNTTRVYIDYLLTATPDNSHLLRLFGARIDNKNKAYVIAFTDSGTNKTYIDITATYGTTDNSTYLSRTECGDLKRHTISITDTYIAIDYDKNTPINSKMYSTYTTSTFTSPCNAYLFAYNLAGTCRSGTYAKVYVARIWNNNLIVRDYVPVLTIATVTSADGTSCPIGSIGLLDLVENKFYLNSGTGTFIAGPVCPQGFPTSEYCLVEWLGTDGTKFFNTGLTDDNTNLEYEIDWTMDLVKNNRSFILGTAWETNGIKAGYFNYYYRDNNGNSLSNNITYTDNIDKLSYKSNTYKVNDTTIATGSNIATNKSLLLMGGSSNSAIGKMHRCLIWQGGTKMRDYIPCYCRSDMTPGFYDLVNRVFTEAPDFLLGPSITFGWGEVVNGSSIGGCKYGLLATSFRTATNNGVTITANSNGTFTASGTATADVVMDIASTTGGTMVGKRYVITGMKSSIGGYLRIPYGSDNDSGEGAIITVTYNSGTIRFLCAKGKTVSGTFTIGVWDLEAMLLSHITTAKELALALGYPNTESIPYKEVDTRYWNYSAYPAIPHNIFSNEGKNGEKNGAFEFDSAGYIDVDKVNLESIFNNRQWTIAMWFNPSVLSTATTSSESNLNQLFVYRKEGDNNATHQCSIALSKTAVITSFWGDDSTFTIPNYVVNKWYHLIVTQNGPTLTVYINGISIGTASKGALALQSGSRMSFGYNPTRASDAPRKFLGRIQDILIWDEVKNPAELM